MEHPTVIIGTLLLVLMSSTCHVNAQIDYISPYFTFCPTEITTYAENGGTTATVDWTLPTVTDDSGVPPQVTSTYDPNSVFSVGNTFVTYTASDESGNVASCFFVVSVIECSLTISSCSNGGTLDPDFCECVCPEDYTGETCEALNPCLETPSLCTTEIGKYCVPDDSVVGYACQCRDYDGFIANSDGSCTETPTLKIGGVTINLPFTSGLTNQQSSAFKEMASKFITEMTRLFGSKEATRSFLSLSVLSFSEGSVVAEMSASFPSGSTLPRITDIMDALAEGTISDGSTDYPIDSSALVVEGTGGADTTIPVISGCPSGASGVLSTQGAIVSWVEPTATDNDGQVVDVSRSHAPSTTFSAGSTTVTYVFTDTAGNEAICSFDVDVTPDYISPFFTFCPTEITTYAENGGTTATVDWTLPTVTDNSGVTPEVTSTYEPNSVFNVGNTFVTYTASDESGNGASCFFVVSVIECSLTISSCSNGGTLDPDFCECVCPEDYTGETCEAPNPCLETPSLCTTEIGKYCVPDDSVAGYACQCRDYDGFIANSDGSCTETPTLKIGGVTINLPFTSGLTNQQSSAFKEMASKFITEMTRLFGSKEATRSFLSLSVLSFSEGSVVAEMSASFPSGSTLPRITDIMDALAEGTISDGSTDYPIDSSALVVEGTGGADTTIPVISGCPSGASGVLSTQGAIVSWVEPTATDNDGQVVDVSRSHAPSTAFSVGSTTVTYVFTDTAGNEAICSFDVDVTPDYISPFFTFCPTEITTYAENGGTTATVDWTLPTVTDNSGVTPEVTSTYEPNSVFNVGNTFVTYTASDESGNGASCVFVVSVIECSLTISSCSNGGTLDPDFCECVCPEDYTGETCEAPNPCLETPSLCTTEIGKYCVPDDSVAGYACQCRDYDGFIANSDGSCTETPTLKIGGVTINLPFTSGLTNQQSSAFKEMASKFITEMTRLFGSKEATRSFLSLSVLSFSEGSVVAEMSASFPSGSTLPRITDIMDALAEGTISDGSTDYPIDSSALVVEGTGGADTTIPVISGCPSGASGVLSTQGAIVSWVEPTATDNDGQVVDVSRSHAPSTAFSVGSTTVTYVFTDTAGNEAICSFDVDVTPDYISPFFTFCPTEITTYAENGGTTATVDWTLPTVTDNSGVTPEVTSTYEPNSVFNVGNTFVTYTASDESGNGASCFFVVSVIECSLTISSCSNGGTLDPDFCECVCPEDYTGETCEALNPCLETPSLCTTEIGKYCVPDDSVVGYACQCRDYDGFIANSDGSCTETPTLKIGGVTINLPFTSGLTNQQSSAFKEMASKFITEMTRLFGSKEATRSFLSLSVLSFSEGSVVAEMSASFPSGSTLPRITDIMDALAEGTISDGSTDYPIDSSALVVEGTGGADTTIPVISGCPSGASGVLSTQGAIVSWVEPTATDNDGQVVDVSRSHAPSTAFSAGSTTVTYVFTDTAGNEAICSFDVDVTPDYISPFFTFCPTEITTYAENGGTTATVDWTLPTVTDNSGVTPEVTSTYEPNSVFNVGNTFVTYTASDESGNGASCFFVVSVIECSLTISSCSNGGTLDPDFCECVCPEDYTGETCEALNPCLETPSLCTTEIGKYCVPDDSVVGYACQCRDYDGFIANSDGSCTETPTLKIGGVTINLPFTSGLTNQQSSAFKEMASKFITEMTRLFGSKEATRSFLSLSVLSFSEGSMYDAH
ncbi:hyalin-like [Asterias rubens]|uniref:hyalin-like n=1 Tax=Asterias rubens TaxID=7604 RepID=UPI001454F7E3|nr:hyalin-like [Asterias rubens]